MTYFVDGSSASCSSAGPGTEAQPYCTIAAALSAHGVAGNTIMVKPGVYREQLSIPASGASGSPLVVQAFASGVIIDGADDYSNSAQWTLLSGSVWLASGVTWKPQQVFLDGARIDSSIAAPASLPPLTFRWVSGSGLYVNAGGGSPATHQAAVGHRDHGFSLPARSFVVVDGFTVTRTEDRGIYASAAGTNLTITHNTVSFAGKIGMQIVGGSGHVVGSNIVHDSRDHGISFTSGVTASTIEQNESYRNARGYERAAAGIYLFGCPSNTLRRNKVHDNEDTGLHIQSGSNNCVEYLNQSWNNGDHGFDHLGSTGTIHNGDVAYGNFKDGFSIEGGATGTQLHNCIAVDNGLTTGEFDLWVEGTSTAGFVSNYNIFYNSTPQSPVKYMTTQYGTVAAYSAASGQDAKTLQTNPLFVSSATGNFHILTGSPAIDAANSGSPNWPSLDGDNLARVNTMGVPNTGAGPILYGDRGAFEFRSGNQAPNGTINTPTANVSIALDQTVNFTGTGTDPDNSLPLSYLWDFHGGAPNSTVEDPGNVAFHTPGTYQVTFTVTDVQGRPDGTPATRTVTVAANQAPNGTIDTPNGNVTIMAGQSVNFTGTATDPDNHLPASFVWNFGSGATNSVLEDPGDVKFMNAGTFPVTFTVTDARGLADPTPATRTITVNPNPAPNGVIDTPLRDTTIAVGQSLAFTSTSTDPNESLPFTYFWNFSGGAANMTVEDPGVVVFNQPGRFIVTFTVKDLFGLPDPTPASRTITVVGTTGVGDPPPASVAPIVTPNPIGRQATLTFSTARPGPLRVEVYDVSGRRVRMLLDDPDSAPGIHVVAIDGRTDDGEHLGSGMHFYRIRSADGVRRGRFLVMH